MLGDRWPDSTPVAAIGMRRPAGRWCTIRHPGRNWMLIVNRFADVHEEIASWRRDFHRHPELLCDVHRTAGRVAELLRSFGVDEVVTGIGRTGVVGVIRGKSKGGVIGLRADMDALPITEATGLPHASEH